ncbi:CynX/NimT family MFS transporter [Rhodovulum sp. YNF3179]|uniref:MFS transporter n=1 Tax=Rhodovulum sp. YNF3179 TaxID=3425127 RepID=UPI003D32FD86
MSVEKTDWTVVLAATFAGMTAALQLGKAAATLPLIRAEFGAGLSLLAVYVSLISVVVALTGLVFGNFTRMIGVRRAALLGLFCVAGGSALGAVAPGVPSLLASRAVEALGFALAVTAMPPIIQAATAARQKSLALGIWAAWLPAGMALMMAIAWLVLDRVGWRGAFWICAGLPLVAAALLAATTPPPARGAAVARLSGLRRVLTRASLLTTGNFVVFSASNLIVMAFLPTLLVDEFAMTPVNATLVAFFTALSLVPSNIWAGWLLDRGVPARRLFLLSFAAMILFAFLLLAPMLPDGPRIAAAFAFGFAAGVPPAVVWGSIPRLTETPEQAPLLSGLLYQGAGIGQVIGPVLAGVAVEDLGGWFPAFWIILALLALGLGFSRGLPRAQPRVSR